MLDQMLLLRAAAYASIGWAFMAWLATNWPRRLAYLGPIRQFITIEGLREHIDISERPPAPKWKQMVVRTGSFALAGWWLTAAGSYFGHLPMFIPLALLAAAWAIAHLTANDGRPSAALVGLSLFHIVLVLGFLHERLGEHQPVDARMVHHLVSALVAAAIFVVNLSYPLSPYSVGKDVASPSDVRLFVILILFQRPSSPALLASAVRKTTSPFGHGDRSAGSRRSSRPAGARCVFLSI